MPRARTAGSAGLVAALISAASFGEILGLLGHTLAAAVADTIWPWNVAGPAHATQIGQLLIRAGKSDADSVVFSQDGRTLASESGGDIWLWDLDVDHAIDRICAATENLPRRSGPATSRNCRTIRHAATSREPAIVGLRPFWASVDYDPPKSGTVIEPSELRAKPGFQATSQRWPSGSLK